MTMPTATSIAAYHSLSIAPVLLTVLEAVDKAGADGLICDEIAAKTGIEYRTVTPRIVQLERLGLVYRAGDTRKGDSGRQQLVVRLATFLSSIPYVPKPKKKRPAFLAGMMHAAKIISSESSFELAKRALKSELIKVAAR